MATPPAVYTFSTGEYDPCPMVMTIPEFVVPWLEERPRTVHELTAMLSEWFPEGEAPTYGNVYEAMRRSPEFASIKSPGRRSYWTLTRPKED